MEEIIEREIMCGEEEFYEKIEAPKFVDFTLPDHHRNRLDEDRFWFCLRVGCDRKHEEEIDHEAISKDFVLRVMAARSPNVRLRKALTRNTCSIKDPCPQSAPAKPTLSRQSKLAAISSISQNKADKGPKTKPISKLTSTPKLPKVKQVAAKYLTTPSHKICATNTNKSFRSVQNAKPMNIAVPKTKTVAKALFKSPKKGICVKTSAELRTPLTKICQGIKKLSINSQRKRILGYSSKSLNEMKQKSTHKDKVKGSSLLKPLNRKGHNSKSLKGLKKKSKGEIGNVSETTMPKGVVENELNDMDIDTKSRISCDSGRNKDLAVAKERSIVKFVEENKEIDTKARISDENNTDKVLANAEERLIVKFEEANKDIDTKSRMSDELKDMDIDRISNENNTDKVLANAEERLIVKFEEANKDIDTKSRMSDELKDMDIDIKSQISYENGGNKERSIVQFVEDNKETHTKPRISDEVNINTFLADAEEKLTVMFEEENANIDAKSSMSDGKKTNTASADTEESSILDHEQSEIGKGNLKQKTEVCIEKVRDEDIEIENDDKENDSAPDYNRSGARNALGKLETETNKKVVKAQGKNLKGHLNAAATGAQVLKYKKPKPTNPKPFKLRTDERRILREAMEIKAPLKKSEAVATTLDLDKRNGSENEKQKREVGSNGDHIRKKVSRSTPQQRVLNLTKHCKNQRGILGEISETSTTKTESPSMQPHFMMPIGGVFQRKRQCQQKLENDLIIRGPSRGRGSRFTTVAKEANIRRVLSAK